MKRRNSFVFDWLRIVFPLFYRVLRFDTDRFCNSASVGTATTAVGICAVESIRILHENHVFFSVNRVLRISFGLRRRVALQIDKSGATVRLVRQCEAGRHSMSVELHIAYWFGRLAGVGAANGSEAPVNVPSAFTRASSAALRPAPATL